MGVAATAFDKRTSGHGCSPDGCTAENTRDSNLDANSRWSCRGNLVKGRGGCCIKYYFEEPQDIVRLNVAFHRGTENIRTLNVYNNGEFHTQIESSGATLEYQEFAVNTDETADLSLCLDDPESNTRTWLSITEVGAGSFACIAIESCCSYFSKKTEPLGFTSSIHSWEGYKLRFGHLRMCAVL